MLAPEGQKKIWSYVIGWLTALAWIATVATESLFAGTIIQGLLILQYPGYEPKQWQGTLLTWAVIATNIFINVVTPGLLPRFELFIMVVHIGAFVGVIAALWSTADIGTVDSVFFTSINNGGWPTQGLSYCVGFLGNVATFVGADASVHMAEEVSNAAMNIPRAIVSAMLINGLIGFIMMLTALFCLGDPDSVLNTSTDFPFLQIFYNSVKSTPGAVAMGAIVLALTWCCSTGITTTASRMTWSFARDKGTPFARHVGKVSAGNRVPVVAVFVVTIFAALLTLIYIGSYTAFNDVISLTITGFYGSYFVPSLFLLRHRIKGHIHPHGSLLDDPKPTPSITLDDASSNPAKPSSPTEHLVQTQTPNLDPTQPRLVWGPWRIPGVLGTLNNAYACVYMVFVIFWSVWPPETPVTAGTMNYSIVVTGGVMILSGVWYVVRGKEDYKGPVVDVDVDVVPEVGGKGSVGGV